MLVSKKYKPYTTYQATEVDWLGVLPKKWQVKRLQFCSSIRNSGVNKKIEEGEELIRLCNYIDVYYHDVIDDSIEFMTASATEDEIRTFRLRKGDVIMTKDSETPDDIGIPAFVSKDFDDVICGYHLCILRTNRDTLVPKFLFYFLKSSFAAAKFEVYSNGVTRFGLSYNGIKTLPVPTPSLEEQQSIANFLDQKTKQIDNLIEQKENLLKLLTEKRTAIITQAVTKGLDPKVKMKDSGIEWLSDVPEHWIVKRLKFLASRIIDGAHVTPTYVPEGVPFLRVTDIVNADGGELNLDDAKFIPENEHKELTRRCKPQRNDVLLSKNGTIGVTRVVDWDFEFSLFVSLCLIKLDSNLIDPCFLSYSFKSKLIENQISVGAKSNTVTNLHLDKIKEFVIPTPPKEEQIEIVEYLKKILDDFRRTEGSLVDSVSKLKEYRSSLITSVVTGQIDVRKEVG